MNNIDIMRVDLNLIQALHALLSEQSVSRAAARLGVGQPAASHALSRLRALLGDPLLVRAGRRMALTPRAEALAPQVARLLGEAARVLRDEGGFDPARTTRTFRLRCPDLLAPAIPAILERLHLDMPNAALEVEARGAGELRAALEEGRVDVALEPSPDEGPGLVSRGLGRLEFEVVARAAHPALAAGGLTLERWLAWPHVLVRTGGAGPGLISGLLARAGLTRRVGLMVPTFLAALHVVADTDLFFAAPGRLVAPLAARLGLVRCAPPLPLPGVPVAALWHERLAGDAGHRLFRAGLVSAVSARLEGEEVSAGAAPASSSRLSPEPAPD